MKKNDEPCGCCTSKPLRELRELIERLERQEAERKEKADVPAERAAR